MHVGLTRIKIFTPRSLSTLSKSTIVGLFGVAVFSTLIWLTIRKVPFFITIDVTLFICAAFIITGIRWAPFLSSFMSALLGYFLFVPTPFAFAHLVHPKGTGSSPWVSFGLFVIIAGIAWCLMMTIALGISAGIQNYRQREYRMTPRWFSPALAAMIGLLLGALLIGAIAQPSSAIASMDTSWNAIVHMGKANFAQTTVTVVKGKKLELVDDGSFEHNVSTGSWIQGQPVLQRQSGGPVANNVYIKSKGTSVEIGPFTTAGTYHLLCTIHVGMTLTVIVQ